MATDYRAIVKNVPISAQKTRLVIDMIRGDIQSAGRALADAMQFEKQGSIRLFHVLLVDRSDR